MKPLTLEETRLKEEMKARCLAKGQYIDEKAKDKFKMLCHLEDFEAQYWELENKLNKVRNNLEKDISVIKNVKMSNKEIICRLEETNKMLKEVSE